jgi:ABC-type uncharacterized transport system involved in gliding motility auxiliary subunit
LSTIAARIEAMNRLATSVAGVAGVLAVLVGINVVAETRLATVQYDATAEHIYTLSPGTRKILAGLKEPITLRFYFSSGLGAKIASFGAQADRVREMLRQFARLSHGKIKLEFYDPLPFSETEDRALAYGLQGVPLDQSGDRVFFGLAGSNLLDDEQSIAFFQPDRERFLEYDMAKLVYDLSSPKRPVLGVMTDLKMDGDPQAMMAKLRGQNVPGGDPWASMMTLRQNFTVKSIATSATTIDPDVKVLLVVHPQNLSEATQYAIDQFVMRGGKLMAMVEPNNETLGPDPQTGAPPAVQASDLPKLFAAWGIAYDPNKVVGDLTGAWRVRARADQGQAGVDYIGYYAIRDGINHDDPATADLQEIDVATPGFLAKKPGSDIEFTPLLTSSDHSEVLPASDFRSMPDPAKLLADFKPDGQRRVIAARIRGVLHSAFKVPPANDPDAAKIPYKAQTDGPANLVVIADTDMLSDRFWVNTGNFFGQTDATPFADNGDFVANLAGTLAGGDALIGLRGRGTVSRPFTVVDAMQRDAAARYQQTEKVLTQHLDETNKKIADLRGGRDGTTNAALNEAQRKAIADLQTDLLQTRTKLRAVQFDLRRDISALETRLRLFDIVLVPVLLAFVAVVMAVWRTRKRRSARA